jgi:tetratricopeptide (TPR) repeat protein
VQGYRDDAIAQIEEARKLDPLSPIVSNFTAMIDVGYGRYDEAIAEAQRLQQLDPSYVYLSSFLADAYREQGKYDEAIAVYQKVEQATGEPQYGLAIAYARMGRVAEARKILAAFELEASKKYVAADSIAGIHVALGDKDQAFRWLQRAYDEHSAPLYGIAIAPEFRALRSDPRFATLLSKLGLDPKRVLAAGSSGG